MNHRVRFPLPQGPIAAPSHAWGVEFDLVVGETSFYPAGDYAVVDIKGPLMQHASWPFCSYDQIRQRVAAAIASDKPKVLLNIASPGGDFAGCLELGRELSEMCKAAKKELCSFTDSQMLSAAYALGCTADKVYATESAYVGSIGVWAALCSEVRRNKALGLDVVIVPSGERKAERNSHVPITDDAVAHLQEQVDDMARMFFDHVAKFRGLTRAKVEGLQGGEHLGRSAERIGLIDGIVEGLSEVTKASADTSQTSQGESMSNYGEALAAMRRAAEGGDEDAKKALRALAAYDDGKKEEGEGEGKGKGKKAKGKAEEEEGKEPKAEGEEEGEGEGEGKSKKAKGAKGEKDNPETEASKALAIAVDLAKELTALKARMNAGAEATERQTLIASVAVDEKVKALLGKLPIETLREAVKDLPKPRRSPAGEFGTMPGPAGVGAGQGDDVAYLPESSQALIDQAMGIAKPVTNFSLGCADVDAARRYLASKKGAQ